VPDLHHGSEAARWPIFTAAVTEQTPARALFALSRQWGAVIMGVLGLYRAPPRTDPADDSGDWLDHALSHRVGIHQATGMVVAQLQISATNALARLRAHAFVHQRLLIDVCRDVVARRLVFTRGMS